MACSGCGKGIRAKTTRERMLADHEAFQLLREIEGGSWFFDGDGMRLVFVPERPEEPRQARFLDPADAVSYWAKSR